MWGGGRLDENVRDQLKFEEQLQRTSIYQYASKIAKLREKGQEATTEPVLHAIQGYITPVASGILEYMDRARKRPGVRAVAYRKLEGADPYVIALLALRATLDAISKPRRIQTVAVRIGREVEEELRFSSYQVSHPGLFYKVQKGIRESPHAYRRDYRRSVMIHTANKFEVPWEDWSESDRAHVGTFLLHVLMEFTGLIEIRRYKDPRGRGMRIDIAGTTELLEWLEGQHTRLAAMRPRRLPMLCEPLPWTGLEGGGYLTKDMQRPLVRIRRSEHRHLFSPENMPVVYEAINYYQRCPFQVDERVLAVAKHLWDHTGELPKAGRRWELDLPEKPPEDAPAEDVALYKNRARKVHFKNQRNRGRRLVVTHTLDIATQVKGRPIWFPYHLDFRGRIYASAQYLTPQGADLSKGLIRFHETKPLGSGGAWWLAVHLANTWGEDKISLQERVDWTMEMSEWILDIARDPTRNLDWQDADKPFQFLQACFEWLGYAEQGEAYESCVSVEIDGSCNGIQHLAAMSRDEEAGALVNLVPRTTPGDIYSRVGEKTTENLNKLYRKTNDEELAAITARLVEKPELFILVERWLAHGVKRSICKRPTMILPYNGTMKAACGYIFDSLIDEEEETGSSFFGDDTQQAANLLGSVMWGAMSQVVSGPRKTMDWLSKVAAVTNKADRPMIWKGPSGFPVVQVYSEMARFQVETKVGDVLYRSTLTAPHESNLDHKKQARASAANVVHSFDAGQLHLVGITMKDQRVSAMRVVHDGYGTWPSETPKLVGSLQATFVQVYGGRDVRLQLADTVAELTGVDRTEIPEPPPLGTLDVERVLEADYFFA